MDDVLRGCEDGSALTRTVRDELDQDSLYAKASADFAMPLARLAAAHESDRFRQQDLLQEIHLRLWRSLARFAGQCSLRTWVYRVAHNTASTHVRQELRSRHEDMISLEDLGELHQEANVEFHVDDEKLLETLIGLIARLKPIDRNVLLLYLEGLKAGEISEVVGISASNIAQKVHRAKAHLRQHFENGENHE
jgi:RNA polymerase sigma-70 factor (ECF subfamily)